MAIWAGAKVVPPFLKRSTSLLSTRSREVAVCSSMLPTGVICTARTLSPNSIYRYKNCCLSRKGSYENISAHQFRSLYNGRPIYGNYSGGGRHRLQCDLSWIDQSHCLCRGDANQHLYRLPLFQFGNRRALFPVCP